jgi:2-keto-4-pentenoate hydratase/2-oxohepta-3-ene-1,7-dioic acid hydratase in catechol pathway
MFVAIFEAKPGTAKLRVGLFLKASSSLIGTSEPIVIRQQDRRTDHEIELAVVIGKKADRVSRIERSSL